MTTVFSQSWTAARVPCQDSEAAQAHLPAQSADQGKVHCRVSQDTGDESRVELKYRSR
ncbi:MAG: hypothetical protein ACYTG5_08625 [Planctomycetota bacterium]